MHTPTPFLANTVFKKLFFYSVIIAVNYVFLELIAYGFYRVKYGDYDRQALQLERIDTINRIAQGAVYTSEDYGSDRFIVEEVIHPYIGYAIDGKSREEGCTSSAVEECYTRIKVPTDFEFPQRGDNRLIVGIMGGSVAAGTIGGVKQGSYEDLFKQVEEYRDREIIILNMTAGGFKQPQQLMALNYYLTLGAEFDILVNIDGFNEAAIPAYEYRRSNLHPSYPRSWDFRVAESISPKLIDLLAEKKSVDAKHSARATLMSNPWFRFRNSPLSKLLWKIQHNNYLLDIAEASAAVENVDVTTELPRDFKYEQLGPDYEFTDWPDLYQYVVDIWARSSSLINDLASANGARYFHFLQPNQYIDGAKPMGDAERRTAIVAEGGYGNLYKTIYPLILDKETWLQQRNVRFNNLTFLYKDISEPLYVDNCCHVNENGYQMIVNAVVEAVKQDNLGE